MFDTSNIRDSSKFDISELNGEVAELLILFNLTSNRITKPDKPESFYRIMDSLLVLKKCQEYTGSIDANPLTFQIMTSDELFLYKRAKAILAIVDYVLPTTTEMPDYVPSEMIHPLPRARPIRSRRAQILLVATFIMVFAIGAVGMASQPYVRTFMQDKNKDATTMYAGDADVLDLELDYSTEKDAYHTVEKCLGIPILHAPKLEELKFINYEINDTQNIITLLYMYNESILQLSTSNSHAELHLITNESPLAESIYEISSTPITIQTFKNSNCCSFMYNTVFYTLTGDFTDKEFTYIIEKMTNEKRKN